METDNEEYLYIIYMYPKRCKWKTKTKQIKSSELDEYKRLYRVLRVDDYDIRE